MHLRVAIALEGIDWRASAAHYLAANDHSSIERVVDASSSRYSPLVIEAVRPFLVGSAETQIALSAMLLRSRVELARGNLERASDLARAACASAEGGRLAGVTLLNLATVLGVSGFPDEAMRHASEALKHDLTPGQRDVALATVAMWEARHRGDLARIAEDLRALVQRQERDGYVRYASVTRLNLSSVQYWRGEIEDAHPCDASRSCFVDCAAPDLERGPSQRAPRACLLGETQTRTGCSTKPPLHLQSWRGTRPP
jgi:predicted negative regulator of RcsB-dependent stress response